MKEVLPLGARELSVIERCLYCRGRNCNKVWCLWDQENCPSSSVIIEEENV